MIPTSTYRLASGTGTDEYGDQTNADTTSVEGVPGSVTEASRTAFDPASNRFGTTAVLIGRFRPGTVLGKGDRVHDERTGESYTVTDIHRSKSGLYTPDLVVDLSINE